MLRPWPFLLCVMACGSATEAPATERHDPETEGREHQEEAHATSAEDPMKARFVPARATLASAPAGTNVDGRLEGALWLSNTGTETQSFTFVVPLAHNFSWTFTNEAGTIWRPTFFPPPMPPPGGPPERSLSLAPGEEAQVVTHLGISGFLRDGAAPTEFGPLPPGDYTVRVGEIRLVPGRVLETDPVTLQVR
ncbi:MAG: hypothetical protein AAGE52_36000 [Myxococcota bacterium]